MSATIPTRAAAYLTGLKHDGLQRLDRWLPFALQHTSTSVPPATYDYLCRVGRYLLLGMVQRAMNPGCKFDHCVVLAGPGGTRKSTLIEALAGDPIRYSSSPLDFSASVGEQVDGVWLYEIAEIAALNADERAALKQVLCAREDVFRPPFASQMIRQPRQCVFMATTNEPWPLWGRFTDRRFWPVPVSERINVEWVSRHLDQLFAEAMVQYYDGARWWPGEEEEAALFAPMQRTLFLSSGVGLQLLALLTRESQEHDSQAIHAGTEFVTLGQLTKALGADPAKSGAGLDRDVSAWLEHHGWQRVKRSIHGVRAWGYQRPPANINAQASLPPASQSAPVRSAPPRMQPAASTPASAPLRPAADAQPQPAPPRFVRHAQSLLRRFGFQLTWTPSGSDGDGASLVIRHALRDKQQ